MTANLNKSYRDEYCSDAAAERNPPAAPGEKALNSPAEVLVGPNSALNSFRSVYSASRTMGARLES